MVFSYKPRSGRDGRIPRQGKYSDEFYKKLDEYLMRLDVCKGRYIIRRLNTLTEKLAQDMATMADLADDDVLFEISHRWTKPMGELVEWLVYHDIWSKMQIFADLIGKDADTMGEAHRHGPKNMLDSLPDSFNEKQLEALRMELGKSIEGTNSQLRKWVFRKFITYSAQTGLYTKTEEYLKGNG